MEERIKKLNGYIEKSREDNTEENNKLTNILNKIDEIFNDDDKRILQPLILQQISSNNKYFNDTKCSILSKIFKIRRDERIANR